MAKWLRKILGVKSQTKIDVPVTPPVVIAKQEEIDSATKIDNKEILRLKAEEERRAEQAALLENLRNYKYPELSLLEEKNATIFASLRNTHALLPILWSITQQTILIKDLTELNAIIIAGTQATGKTNFIHQLLLSLLFKKHPTQLKLVLIDYSGIDLSIYSKLEKSFLVKLPGIRNPVLKDFNDVKETFNSLCIEMDNRYELMADARVRNISEYTKKIIDKELDFAKGHQYLPSIVIVIDDLSKFTHQQPEEINLPLVRLVSEGYKAGIFCIIATSYPTGQTIPNNLLGVISHRAIFRMNNKEDYRKYFSTTRFEIPFRTGEFLYNDSGKIMGAATVPVSDVELQTVIGFIGEQKLFSTAFLLPENGVEQIPTYDFDPKYRDSLFDDAARLIVQNQIGSTSLLQRRMKLGYNRTGRLMDQLEAAGIVGPNQGSKARDVLVKTTAQLEDLLKRL